MFSLKSFSHCLRRSQLRSSYFYMDRSQVVKSGLLKKVKRGKKRFFVLRRDETNLSASRLDCYETEKKFLQGTPAKSSLLVAEFFNVNRLSLMKNEFCLAIYTKDTSLYLSCDNIAEQEAWLQALVELVEEERTGMPSSSSAVVGQQPQTTNITSTVPRGVPDMATGKPLFEYCWEIVVTKFESKDGSHPRKCPRPNCAYRFCLTEEEILLMKKLSKLTDPEEDWTFELNSVSSYGLQGEIFYLTVGRFTITGSGQLFMKGEDSTTTANIYKTLQRTFEETKSRRKSISEIKKSIGLTPRSSTISRERSNSVATQNRTRGYSESEKTLMNSVPFASSMASSSGMDGPGVTATSPIITAFRKTSAHIFRRMRTSSEDFCDVSLSTAAAHRKSSESRLHFHLPHLSLRPAAIASRSYQQQKAPSAEALESDPRLRSFAPSSGYSKPQGTTYSRFDSHNCSTDSVGSSYSIEETTAYHGKPRCPSAELVDNRSAIKEETPGDEYLPMEKIPSVNVTSASAPPSKGPSSPDGYLLMAQIPASQANSYCTMSADNQPNFDATAWKKLEEVKSYISDSGESWPDPTSVRSYSLGSRPTTNHSEPKTERPATHLYQQDSSEEAPVGIPSSLSSETCQQIAQEDRRRAYSFGNWR